MQTKLCRACGVQYNPELSSCPMCGQLLKKTKRLCCGKEIEKSGNNKYCLDCRNNTKKLYNREYKDTLRKEAFKDGTRKANKKIEKAYDQINASYIIFQTNLCDQDCENCKYDDCILPEEDA